MSGELVRLDPGPGQRLQDLLFDRGVEFPCGGAGTCGGCKVRVVEGDIPVTPPMRDVLSPAELAAGQRLACMAEASGPVTLEIAQWSLEILGDHAEVPFEPATGLGAAVDIGTTTLVAQLVDLSTSQVLAVQSALNPQARFGSDLMSRIQHDLAHPGELGRLVRQAVGAMLAKLSPQEPLEEVLLVGNTAMHHLFCGLSVEPLSAVPFRPTNPGPQRLDAHQALGWEIKLKNPACFLPCIGGFVGSDLLAGLVATDLHQAAEPTALIDIGTNGEIALGNSQGIRCASTAAGPAFEGGRISMGMRASTGAIDGVTAVNGHLVCSVIGGSAAKPRGLCGSGLVDAAAAALELGWILPSGRLAPPRKTLPLAGPVAITQADLRELQLAKAALRSGLELLLKGQTLKPEGIILAGAFGSFVKAESARRIGLLPQWALDPRAGGNSALRGARLLLLSPSKRDAIIQAVLNRCQHVELATDPAFQDAYVNEMPFPEL